MISIDLKWTSIGTSKSPMDDVVAIAIEPHKTGLLFVVVPGLRGFVGSHSGLSNGAWCKEKIEAVKMVCMLQSLY